MPYLAAADRYSRLPYRRCGRSGLELPAISLGLWQNFGGVDSAETGRQIILKAFDRGVTHFDLANNYGPPPGSAESMFGEIINDDLKPYRDEIVVSTKAGYRMWDGPYGEWGSRKYVLASLDQSLKRMKLDYVDIFYSHRLDPSTPLEETVGALETAVKSGKALYVGISSYSPEATREAHNMLKERGIRTLIHQPSYSMLNRWVENGLIDTLQELGIGCIAFSPLAQGLLSDKYLKGTPNDARASREGSFSSKLLTPENLERVRALDEIARKRGQSLAQMAIAWVLRHPSVTSALIGARTVAQLENSLDAMKNAAFSKEELAEIDKHAKDGALNLWSTSAAAKPVKD
jgi:L-glyceraldehyde 3-phosphate reductase